MALDNELSALNAWGIGHVDSCPRAIVGTAGELCDSVGFGVQDIALGQPILVFADVLKAYGCAIISIGDDALVFDDEGTYLPTLAIGVLSPDASHAEIPLVECSLFLLNSRHSFA